MAKKKTNFFKKKFSKLMQKKLSTVLLLYTINKDYAILTFL